MSVAVSFNTSCELTPKDIFQAVAERGERLVVADAEWPVLRVGREMRALRGVELYKTDDGYDVRVCTMASADDYRLFPVVVDVMRLLTNAVPLLEGEADDPIDNPLVYFGDDWLRMQGEVSLGGFKALIGHIGSAITFDGFFFSVSIGAGLMSGLLDCDFDEIDPEDFNSYQTLTDTLTQLQWKLCNATDTATGMVLQNPDDEKDDYTVSAIYVKDGAIAKEFNYISYADTFTLFDLDAPEGEKSILIPFRYVKNIVSGEKFLPLDEYQMFLKEPLDYLDIEHMKLLARRFQPDDIFARPVYPGQGHTEGGRTFVLRWNTAISNVTEEDFQGWRDYVLQGDFNWSVWDFDKARMGDKFYFLRVEDGKTGIVASGVFDSQPYPAPDWSGKGRPTHYMDLSFNFLADPEGDAVFPMAELESALPDFDWNHGHSGVLLPDSIASALDLIWNQYLAQLEENENPTYTIFHKFSAHS